MAPIVTRVLFTWSMVLLFIIFLNLKLDGNVDWNWFLVLNPMWIFDTILIIHVVMLMIWHCKHGATRQRSELSMARKVFFLVCMLLKLSFQVLVCLKVEYFDDTMPLSLVSIPLWLLLATLAIDVTHILTSRNCIQPRGILRNRSN